ncbi:MAG: putative fumarylacetoacetate hydrolase protein [Burkholderiales bacterium]|jgi:2-keto-4-pentenoate hydratase/2-oxohepta-3-ene-1,7-dioic acid hydratase in catechol pathway|nr:putative fumarylacetoacetate hydrolase protein [Burkholderiales bacterium]
MKLGRFALDATAFYGVVEGDDVYELDGSPFKTYRRTERRHRLAGLQLLVPCMPSNFYCAGLNYAAHIEWANQRTGGNRKLPDKADIGYRSPNALIPAGEAIVIPADSPGPVQFEGELVAVIGKAARHLSEAEALSCVLGYTLGNDVSERTWQKTDRTLWRAKNCDTFKPMGPFIVTELDPMDLTIAINVNGKKVSEYHTGKMLFSAQHYISQISKYITLWPGDVVWLGTDNATEPSLQHGDRVEVIQEDIGVLANAVVHAGA